MNIDKLLETEAGAKAVKAKLKAMSASERSKPNVQVIWQKACNAVNQFSMPKPIKKETTTDNAKSSNKINKFEDPKVEEKVNKSTNRMEQPKLKLKAKIVDKVKPHSNKKQDSEKNKLKAKKPTTAKVDNNSKQKSNEPKQIAIKQFPKEESIKSVERLCNSFPALFDLENPKPLKIGIDQDIKNRQDDWDDDFMKAVMRTYVGMELYNYNFIKSSFRYNLDGEQDERIKVSEKDHAKKRIVNIIGRFECMNKYPKISHNVQIIVKPLAKKSYGYLYYYPNIKREFFAVLKECFGHGYEIIKDYEDTEDGMVKAIMTVALSDGRSFKVESCVTNNRKYAITNCQKRLLVRLQKTIEAYPFKYNKPILEEEMIIEKEIIKKALDGK